jgi:stage IV sporulation protein FB
MLRYQPWRSGRPQGWDCPVVRRSLAKSIAMRETSGWTLNLGQWGSTRVYVHATLIVFVVLIVYLARLAHRELVDDLPVYAYGLLYAAMFVIAVVVHELGHVLATWRLGGTMDLVVLGPLGGMYASSLPHEPHREVREAAVALAGLLANLTAMIVLGPALLVANISLGDILLAPLHPGGMILAGSIWLVALKMLFWFNWLLFGVNLVPAMPLDMGRVVRGCLWRILGPRGTARVMARSALLVALILTLFAVFLPDRPDLRLIPTWLPLVLLAIYVAFSARQEIQLADDQVAEDDLFGYDFSEGYTSLEESAPRSRHWPTGPLRRWLRQRRELKQRRLRDIEADEERRFDEVLVRINQQGMESLTPEERDLLHRVSARYRNRSQS